MSQIIFIRRVLPRNMWKGAFVCLLQGQGKPSNEVALQVYERLAETRGVVTRFRGKETGYCGCLCGTIGTEHDVSRFLLELKGVLDDIHSAKAAANRVSSGEEK